MARVILDQARLGVTTLTGGGGAQTLGQIAMATLAAGMSNGTQLYIDVTVALFDNVAGGAYAQLITLTVACALTAGPTYTLGTVSSSVINSTGSGPTYSVATLDISGGNLRVRITPAGNNVDGYAVVSTLAP
jgi:hypothetical protein